RMQKKTKEDACDTIARRLKGSAVGVCAEVKPENNTDGSKDGGAPSTDAKKPAKPDAAKPDAAKPDAEEPEAEESDVFSSLSADEPFDASVALLTLAAANEQLIDEIDDYMAANPRHAQYARYRDKSSINAQMMIDVAARPGGEEVRAALVDYMANLFMGIWTVEDDGDEVVNDWTVSNLSSATAPAPDQ
ncbi:MAG: hypothetical protein WD076_09495, partial [Parvularculaceae bacterium]